ncbi:DUF4234 domain-containing protein [Fervidicoccus fontis]|uniref:DUF4234 domain-containing protein n=1 Tax=Fervidicoccus fontis TaxID=683846 RepID=UPI001D14C884|nr:DUF4234 domain-containing protein [Fervidicoccus fontis]
MDGSITEGAQQFLKFFIHYYKFVEIDSLYILYVYHFLNKDFVKHSQKERLLLSEVIDEIREKVPLFTRRIEEFAEVPDRSTLLYVILYFITCGLFGIYWVYTLTNDPNRHFESHQIIEKELITALKEILSKQ